MLKVFFHNPLAGRCTYVALQHEDSQKYLDLATDFLFSEKVEIKGVIGISRLHPEDKNYKKSTGREMAEQNASEAIFTLVNVSKNIEGRTLLHFLSGDVIVLVLASNKKRPHLRIEPGHLFMAK